MHSRNGSAARWQALAIGLAVVVGSLVVVRAADKAKFISSWRDGDIAIDGSSADWSVLSPVAKDLKLSIGLANDRDFLYVAFETSEPATSVQILQQGLIVWFDAQGGKKRQFGVRYPIGPSPEQGAPRGGGRGGNEDDGGLGPGALPDLSRIYARAAANGRLRRFEILGDGKEPVMTSLDAAAPLELKTGWSEGLLVYELKVPLAIVGDLPGLGVQPGALIGLGLETPKIDRDRVRRGQGGMGGRGGMGGGMGGMGGGMGGRGGMGGQGGFGGRGGPRLSMPEPMKLWTTVRLSTAPAAK